MKNLVTALFISILGYASGAQAFLIATFDTPKVDYAAEVDVIVIGYAGELGSGFLRTAMTIANKINEQHPDRQIVMYAENRTKDGTASVHFKNIGATVIYNDGLAFTTTKLMNELQSFDKIHTLHVVSHNALENGAGLTDRDVDGRWSSKTPGLSKINFTGDGYVVLHGCNTGFLQAPEWSRIMKVPVYGSLTATNFQQIFDDGEWYFHDVGLYPEGASFLTTNNLSFSVGVPCGKGGCYRLKPDFFAYDGFWGDFGPAGGLSFLKAFCTFGDDQTTKNARCQNAMRQYMQIYPSHLSLSAQPSLDEYKAVVKDFLCGIRLNHDLRQECYEKLEESEAAPDLIYAGFTGNVLKCDNFGPCDYTLHQCDNSVHICSISAKVNNKPRTIVQEYLNYIEAFNQ